jgi:hypothetical protein
MNIPELKYCIESIIASYMKVYNPDKIARVKFEARYSQLLSALDFNLVTFGKYSLIRYFISWTNKERFGKLEYYSSLLASGETRGELFFLYATVKINDTIVSFLRLLPEEGDDEPKSIPNKVLFKLQRSIEHFDSIADKLEVLRAFYEEQVERKIEVPEIFKDTPIGGVAFRADFREEVESISFKLFPEARKLYTSLYIPDSLFQFNFEFVQEDPEFTFWFLKYNARKHFESYVMAEIYEDLLSPLRNEHILGYLKDLEREEQTVRDLVSKHQIHADLENPDYTKETELLRIIEGYYEINPVQDVFAAGNLTVEQYARHIYLREYLVSLQAKPVVPTPKKLIDYFGDPALYNAFIEVLIREGKCHIDTHVWIDSGSGSKTHLAELFTILHQRGYLKFNQKMKPAEKQAVALITFGVKLSIDTAKRSSNPSEKEFKYIPLASKLSDPD